MTFMKGKGTDCSALLRKFGQASAKCSSLQESHISREWARLGSAPHAAVRQRPEGSPGLAQTQQRIREHGSWGRQPLTVPAVGDLGGVFAVVTFHPSAHTNLLPHQVQRAAPPRFPWASLPKGNREKDGGLTTAPVSAANRIPPSSLHSEFPHPQQPRQMLAASPGSVPSLHAKGNGT